MSRICDCVICAGCTYIHNKLMARFVPCIQFAVLHRALLFAPDPNGLDAPADQFSEARALKIAEHLSRDIGRRLVSLSSTS
jgi:hypothetical protein